MSEASVAARKAMKEKAHRLATGDPHAKVDASSWTPSEPLNTTAKTGLRPISKRQYKRGGKVEGEHARKHAGRKPRKAGGRALVDDLVNRDVKQANEEREGIKHVGGMKRGGRTHKDSGGPLAGPISQGMGGQGRMSFNYPQAGSPAAALTGMKKGGKPRAHKLMGGALGYLPPALMAAQRPGGPQGMVPVQGGAMATPMLRARGGHVDEAEDRKLIRREVKTSAIKGHPDGCRCHRCMGGSMNKGGSVSDGTLEGARPTGGRLARKSGGEDHWIKGAIRHPGALHRELGVPEGKKIPAKKLAKAAHKSGKEGERARLAETLKHMDHHAGGRTERARGGRSGKGKMNVNVIIAQPHPQGAVPPVAGPGMPAPAPRPQGVPVAMPPTGMPGMMPGAMPMGMPMGAMGAMGGMPPQAMPPGMNPMMPRKRGGRAKGHEYEGGAGGGLGRLEKAEEYGGEARKLDGHY